MFSLRPPFSEDIKPIESKGLTLVGQFFAALRGNDLKNGIALLTHFMKNQVDNLLVIILARVNLLCFSCTCLSRKSSSCWNSRPTALPQRHCWRLLGSSSKLRNARTQNGCRATGGCRFSSKEPRTESTSVAKRSKKRWKRRKSATCSRPTTASSKTSLSIF